MTHVFRHYTALLVACFALIFAVFFAAQPVSAAAHSTSQVDEAQRTITAKKKCQCKPSVKTRKRKKVVMKWNAVDGATKYQVQMFKGKKKKAARKISTTKKKHTFKKLKAGTVYRFRVRAKVDGTYTKYSKKRKVTTKQPSDDSNEGGQEESDNEEEQEESESEESTQAIGIENFSFSPDSVTVSVGTTVTWTNEDGAPHTVDSTDGGPLDSGTLSQGETYSYTFTEAGTYAYRCDIHTGMTATITVE